MKKSILILFVALVGMSSSLMSQKYVPVIEAKIAPVKIILGGISGSADFVLNDNMSIESVLQYKKRIVIDRKVLSLQGMGKYYLNSKKGADQFYVGPYLKIQNRELNNFKEDRIALGIISGFKVVSDSGFVFDITGGFGGNLYSNVKDLNGSNIASLSGSGEFLPYDYITRISIGYRFGTVNDHSNTGKLQRKEKLDRKVNSDRRR